MSDTIAFILKGYPRLSETFIAQEIHALERRGLSLFIYSLRRPADPAIHPVHREIAAPVTYLPEYLKDQPLRVLRGWWSARRMSGYRGARRTFLGNLLRDPTPNRVRRFGQACVLAAELPDGITRLHAHFLHTPASVTRYAAQIAGLPWSASAHAKDIWTTPDWELAEKLNDADWVVTCTAAGRARLGALAPSPDKVGLVYHGLDLSAFHCCPRTSPCATGTAQRTRSSCSPSAARWRRKATATCWRPSLACLPGSIGVSCTSAGASSRKNLKRGPMRSS